ncbi:Polyprenol reductase 1 [Colletotrichum sidae]|uniref:Polyprenal reductase n=1 Tax=Colletotrichum sidae TaxID=1347389 RepID=A0A4V3I1Q4_9PEZI|nr:Polyprenol reductase 1 [Colletotrichum sidae]
MGPAFEERAWAKLKLGCPTTGPPTFDGLINGPMLPLSPAVAETLHYETLYTAYTDVQHASLAINMASSLQTATEALSALTPAQWCQAFFGLSSAAVLAIQIIPKAAQHALLDYGARSPEGPDNGTRDTKVQGGTRFNDLVEAVASVGQIPHAWFMHFYVASVAASVFWAFEYLRGGHLMQCIAARQAQSGSPSMNLAQTLLVWALMALQASRRLYECFFVMKPGSSKMWFVHWLLGLGFYLCMSVSVWVDGSASLQAANGADGSKLRSLSVITGTATYFYGWSRQHWCHKHLASLRKYSLPERGLFRYLVCPHYTCECLIYLGLAIAAAPEGQWINRTVLGALWFIVANLGTTADGTKQWYAQRFGAEKVAARWRMIPFVF